MPPILPAADEESLDRDRSALAGQREHVGIAETFGVDGLAALDVGQRAQTVAVNGGELEVAPLRRLGHLLAEPCLHPGRSAGEERLRVLDQLVIVLLADAAHAWRRAALDLVEQTRPRSILEIAVGTTS